MKISTKKCFKFSICIILWTNLLSCSDKDTAMSDPEIPLIEKMLIQITTTNNNLSVKLPLTGTLNCEIDWNDGNLETFFDSYPTHTYAREGTYLVTISGTVTALYSGDLTDSERSCITGLYNWGNTGLTILTCAFEGCSELTTIPDGLSGLEHVTDFNYTFSGCSGLTEIPGGLFDNCKYATSFSHTFYGCTGLTEIPAGLFDKCTAAKGFTSTFQNCESLTGIPSGLFDNCVNVTSFYNTFSGCSGLTEIPSGLFHNCTLAREFFATFQDCESLKEIPVGLFDNCMRINNLVLTFAGCKNLTGESPYTIVNDRKVHLYERTGEIGEFNEPGYYTLCFSECVGLTDFADIPDGWK